MKTPWLPGIRALLMGAAELKQLRLAAERIANALEGKSAPAVSVDPLEEPIHVRSAEDFGLSYAIEQRLRRQLGRDPTADEIVRELDGVEP